MRIWWVSAVVIGVLVAGTAVAQQLSSIAGQVTDSSGAGIPAVHIIIRNTETGTERDITADEQGRYDAPSLSIGAYAITGSKEGFKSANRTGIQLVVGQAAHIDLVLPVGDVQQTVTVTERPDVVSLSTQQTSGLVNEQQVKELPLNGRSYDELLLLNPGIVNYTSQRSGGVGSSNSAIGNMFSVSGRRPQESIFLLNGIEYTSASQINLTPGGASGQLLGVDAVREFNVVADTYGAEYGKRPGGQVSIVTSSGTNQLHGAAYEFIRNSALDARNPFDAGSVPGFERNEFGVSLGGPIQRDKTFLFGNYEGFRQRLGLSDVTLVPDDQARQGIIGGTQINVPSSVSKLFDLWPRANGGSLGQGIGRAFSNPVQHIREDFGTTRLDHVFSPADNLSAIYTVDDSFDTTPSQNPFTSVVEGLREQVASVEETHVFSPRLVNTARIGFSRGAFFYDSEAPAVGSFVGGAPIGTVIIGGGTAGNGATQITNGGSNATSNTIAVRNLFTYTDQLDWNVGRHHLQGGASLQRIQANDLFAQAQYGQATFSSLQAFLQGSVTTFTAVPSPTELGWRSTEFGWYLQDTIRFGSRLEINVGFRGESTNGWNEVHGRASNYLFDDRGVLETNPTIGSSAFSKNRAKFLPEPRAGLAWDPFGNGHTVIHAGFGVYNALLDNLSYRLDQNAPFNTTVVLKNVALSSINLTQGGALPAGGSVSPAGVQPDMYTPTVLSWTFKVEQRINRDTAVAVGYVGSHGYHEILSVDANEPYPSLLPDGRLYYPKNAPFANPKLAASTTWLSEGISSYNGLQVDFSHRLAQGFQVRGVYTYSKSLDDGGTLATAVGANAPAFVMYPGNPKLDYGLSTFDVRHLATVNGTYQLPFSANRWIRGWSIAGVLSLQSGFPFTPALGFNPTNNGDSRNPIRPSWSPAFQGSVITHDPSRWFDPSAFVVPDNGTYGNVGRNTLIGPGMATLDASLLKDFPIRERLKAQFRAEFFNVLNHSNFSTPNNVVYTSATAVSPTAGVITATSTTSRQIQFGLKLLW